MNLFTTQMGKWRTAKNLNIPLYDITVKSGDTTFSPTWELLNKFKEDGDREHFTKEYTNLMRISFIVNRDKWVELASMECVAIACYCGADEFCHRMLLADMLSLVCKKLNIKFNYVKELV